MKTKWLAGAALALLINAPLHADQGLIPLGKLMGRAEAIVIGSVIETRAGAGGQYVMTVAVEQTFKGAPPERVQIYGSSVDSTSVRPLSAGMRILTFLAPRTLQPVSGEHGVQVLPSDESVRAASDIVQTALAQGTALQMRDVAPYFGSRATPRVLMGSLLTELSTHVTPSVDGRQLAQYACDGSVVPAVQLWAIAQSGRLQIAGARPCLESLVRDPRNGNARIAATEALGNLKMTESVPVLLTLLEPLPRQIIEPTGDDEPSSVRPTSEPEDESSPVSNPAEENNELVNDDEPVGEPPSLPDGDIEPDGASSDDVQSRRGDGGLSEAAVLALGKIGDPAAVRDLTRIANEGDDLSLHSTVVVALGLIGGQSVIDPLTAISRSHPNDLVRDLATQTLARLQSH